jgi:ELWxxDGT repeat protein
VLLFRACDEDGGCEPWVIRPDLPVPMPVSDVLPGPASSAPRDFTVQGDAVFFSAYDETSGRELWALPVSALVPEPGAGGLAVAATGGLWVLTRVRRRSASGISGAR